MIPRPLPFRKAPNDVMTRCLRRPFLLAHLLALVLAVSPALTPPGLQAQEASPMVPLPPGHWAYQLLEALDLTEVDFTWTRDFRALPEAFLQEELTGIVEAEPDPGEEDPAKEDEATRRLAAAWVRTLREERALEPSTGDPPGLRFAGEAGIREGDGWLDPGAGAFGTLFGAASLGRETQVWAEGAAGGWDRFPGLRSGGISSRLGPFSAVLGRQFIRASGPGSANMLLGGSVPLDGLYLTTNRPRNFPLLSAVVGPASWQFALAPLEGLDGGDRGWIGLGGIIARPFPNLQIGATRVARFGGKEGGITPARLFRTVFVIQNVPTYWDDHKLDVSVRYDWGLGPLGFSSYFVMAQEDRPIYKEPGIVAGTRASLMSSLGLTMLEYEYSGFGTQRWWCAWCRDELRVTNWYRHGRKDPYDRKDVPMGHPLAGYGAGHTLTGRFWSADGRFTGKVQLFREQREGSNLLQERWPGVRWGGEVEGNLFPAPGYRITLSVLLSQGEEMGAHHGVFLGVRRALSFK